MKLKRTIKNTIIMFFPSLYYGRVRKQYYKLNILNNLSFLCELKHPYHYDGVYLTMPEMPTDRFITGIEDIPNHFKSHPVAIVQYGLSSWGFYCTTKEKSYLSNVKKIGKWLLDTQDKDTGLWYYRNDYLHGPTGAELKNPWASAMAQGEAASLLVRLWTVTHDDALLVAAKKAFDKFDVDVQSGGLMACYENNAFFEEYPTYPHSHTLNGMIFALFGLFDLSSVLDDDRIKNLFNCGLQSIIKMLPLYDNRFCSLYDLSYMVGGRKRQSEKYHIIHIEQLQCLNYIAPNDVFEFYIKKWMGIAGCRKIKQMKI